ncbi:lipopolysaccharide biosynthesis protein [Blastococcus sp. TBT05-19]|uniref:lipopolysaccharide biosynthesis protein n=1 Tax=Blastococcus sp. TBT05-19 TaxID=2250581 RepID=UPI001314EA53|nr:lipopolysaccharide biosynthesis protein [Blastococcus sp. TBT05-19]
MSALPAGQATAHRHATTGRAIRRGLAWTALWRIALQILQLGTSIALARLLAPSDFGLVALAATITGFATLFAEFGIAAAVIQRPEPDREYLTSAFWLNALLGCVGALAIWAISPLAAIVLEAPDLAQLLPVAGLSMALSLGVVHGAVLRRKMNFARVGVAEVLGGVANAASAISLAAAGLGPWALVSGTLVGTATTTVAYWMLSPMRPTGWPTLGMTREIWRYSRGLIGFNAVNYWSRNADNLLVGKFIGTTALGFYSRAYNAMLLPLSQVSTTISTVMFPALARLQSDARRLGEAWLVSTKASWIVGAPLGLGVCVAAGPLVETLFGARWLPVAPILSLLALSVPCQLLGQSAGPLFQATGRTALQFKLGVISSLLTVLAVGVAVPFGVVAVAAAIAIKSWLTVWIVVLPALRCAAVPLVTFLRSLAGGAAASIAAAGVAWIAGHASAFMAAPMTLLAQVVAGASTYAVALLLLERPFIRRVRGRSAT